MVSGARWPDASCAASPTAFPVCCSCPLAAAASAATVGAIGISEIREEEH
jgi:hypothetical protein